MTKRQLEPALLSLIRRGVSVKDAAKTLDVHPTTARRWLRDREQSLGPKEYGKLAEISGLDLNVWAVDGPLLRDAVTSASGLEEAGYTVWESFEHWGRFYAEVRDAWLLQREERDLPVPAAERLYQCWLDGGDLDAERQAIRAERSVAAPEAVDGADVLIVPTDDGWPSLGAQVCEWVETFLTFGPGDLRGEPATLDAEKRWLIHRMYELYPQDDPRAGRRHFSRVGISICKGWSKTELASWIAATELHHEGPVRCVGWADGQPIGGPLVDPFVSMGAYTEEQSDQLAYSALRTVLQQSAIADDFDVGLERVLRARGDGQAMSLAASPSARDGMRTTLAVFDETHWWTSPRLRQAHQTMLANIPKRKAADGWSLEVTTSFEPNGNSIAEDAMDHAKQVAAGKIADSSLLYYHRQASDDLPLETVEDVRKAVIAASGAAAEWRNTDSIVNLWLDPTTDRAFFRRVWLNQVVTGSRQAFDVVAWEALATYERPADDDGLWTLGFDGAQFKDSTALVAAHVETGYLTVLGLWEDPHPTDPNREWQVPAHEVDAVLRAAFERFDIWRANCDPFLWQSHIAKWQGEFGDRIVEWRTNRRRQMSHSLSAFLTAIQTGELRHDGNKDLARHIANCRKRETNERDDDGIPLWLIEKERSGSPHKIDLAMAAILSWQARTDAIAAGMLEEAEPSVYESRGLLVLG